MDSLTEVQTTPGDFSAYPELGYCWPLRALSAAQADVLRGKFLDYWNDNIGRFKDALPRERTRLLISTHLGLRWVYELASHPAILDAVERVLGPDLMIWDTHWFPKFPGDATYVSWHQDATYWGLQPPDVTTAWIALSTSDEQNGCLRVVPGTHTGDLLPQRETYAPSNMLSRGQEIAVEVDETRAVALVMQPGEFSLHHIGIVHGSGPNIGAEARIGLAVRFIAPHVVQQGEHRDVVLLVRGTDRHGHFDIAEPPDRDWGFGENIVQAESLDRKIRNSAVSKGREST